MVEANKRPNILLLVADDAGATMNCYGAPGAVTPNIDRLASQGTRFSRFFTHGPVCAPSRHGMVTGCYATATGAHPMRTTVLRPPPMFTEALKQHGYRVSWSQKTDFNFEVPQTAIDDAKDCRVANPPAPFFAYLHFGQTHESRIRVNDADFAKGTARLTADQRHDPARVTVPPFFPDTPEVRRDIARNADNVTALDYEIGDTLAWLERSGQADNTIVIFTADHGAGLPRHKRWVYDGGIHIPLIVRGPGIAAGAVREDLAAMVDLAPTILSLAGLAAPPHGHGQVILGPQQAAERRYVFAARDRMDEAFDRIRAVRDKRFKYIRNFRPDLPYAQRIDYAELMPTLQSWRNANAEGKLNATQSAFFKSPKPEEELYDVVADPWETTNLAGLAEHRQTLIAMRAALADWQNRYGDLGEVPERELIDKGLLTDRLTPANKSVKPLPADQRLPGGPWDAEGKPVAP